MSKKPELRCDSYKENPGGFTKDFRCVLRRDHVGQCLAWDDYNAYKDVEGYEPSAVRWSREQPCPYHSVLCLRVTGDSWFATGDSVPCLGVKGHTGPCQFERGGK